MYSKMISQSFQGIAVVLVATLLQSCGLFGSKGTASERANRRGEVTGVPNRSGWQQTLPHEMVAVKAGTFWMGHADGDSTQRHASLNTHVTMTEFFMDKYEVSNNKYRAVLEAVRPRELTYGTPTTLDEPPQFNFDE